MTVQVSYPGVYIHERKAAGPIEGVGTSTAAFLGPADQGEPDKPRFVTSFDEFRRHFGERPLSGFYLWHAVKGSFENGGKRAYIVRVSNGTYAKVNLVGQKATQTVLVVRSRHLGASGILVTVKRSSYVNTTAFQPKPAGIESADKNKNTIKVKEDKTSKTPMSASQVAAQFRTGDEIQLKKGSSTETAIILRVMGGKIVVKNPLTADYAKGTFRLADLPAGAKVLRVKDSADGHQLGRGSVISIEQSNPKETAVVASVQTEQITPEITTYRLTLEKGLTSAYKRDGKTDIKIKSEEFALSVNGEKREHLSMARNNPRYFGTIIEKTPFGLVVVEEPDVPSSAPLKDLRPAELTNQKLTPGKTDKPDMLKATDYQEALDALREVDEVNFIAMPDSMKLSSATERATAQLALLTHCTEMADRFAIFDPPAAATRDDIGDVVDLLRSERGFGALYFPWIRVPHPDGGTLNIPPSGHVAGVYARSDLERGVHKAPANFILNGALGVVHDMNNEQQGILNMDGINVLRVFPDSSRPVVWGARTTSNNTTWQYVNIRRLMLFIEESLEEGLRWAVFEPNNLQLWQKVRRSIVNFLTNVWRSGALFGATAEEAFYVVVDESNNPSSERQLGRLHIEIGVCPAYPAEFIIVHIGLWEGGGEVTEL